MFLQLFHGRKNLDENLDDWGSQGGQFEIENLFVTYMSHVRVQPKGSRELIELNFSDDCLYYNGIYYGDWSVTVLPIEGVEIEKLDVNKTKSKQNVG